MSDELKNTITIMYTTLLLTYSLLGLVLWYFKRDGYLIMFPTEESKFAIPMLTGFSVFVTLIDQAPGPRIGFVLNGVFALIVVLFLTVPPVMKRLANFRDKIQGNKVQ